VAHADFLWRRLGQVDAARGVFKRCYARANMESLVGRCRLTQETHAE